MKSNHKTMKSTITIIALVLSMSVHAQDQFQNEVAGSMSFASQHVMELAEAMPADKYSWSPEEGVRSFKDVCTHVISANYFFAMKIGAAIPEGVDMMTIESDLKTKDEITAALKQSYEVILKTIKEEKSKNLKNNVEFPFPGEYTEMTAILIAMSHTNEHLGQMIAYARMNNVTPPWSEEEGEY